MGYITDPHKKSRAILTAAIESERLNDLFPHFHPNERSYTFRTANKKKRVQLDIGMASPSMLEVITSFDHIAHPFSVTDHSSTFIKLDFTKSTKGDGIFRCPPDIHNDITYHRIACNTIKSTILNSITETPISNTFRALFEARLKLEEELHALETVVPTWPTNE